MSAPCAWTAKYPADMHRAAAKIIDTGSDAPFDSDVAEMICAGIAAERSRCLALLWGVSWRDYASVAEAVGRIEDGDIPG